MNCEGIRKHKLFQGIAPDHLERMLECSKSRFKRYKKGAMIFHQEEDACCLYVLVKGRVMIVKHLISGRKNTLYEVEEGKIFGEHYIFGDSMTYQYSAQASTDIEVLEIPCTFFYSFCAENCGHHQILMRNILGILATKEWLSIKKLNIVSASSLKERISIWLMDEADEDGMVYLKMNREELADYLGVARPSLSRALMRMQSEEMIDVGRNYMKIINYEKIENFCN